MAEQVFYNDRGVLVTNTRFEVKGQLFAMANITSVRAERRSSWGIAGLMMLFGLGVGFFALQSSDGSGGLLCAALTFLAGLGVGLAGNSTSLYIATAGGEVKAMTHSNQKFIEDVATGVKMAIINRG